MENQNYNRIEDYLLQRMSAAERLTFETELSNNEALSAQFQQQQLEHEAMDFFVEKDLRQKLEIWKNAPHNDGDNNTNTTTASLTKNTPTSPNRFLFWWLFPVFFLGATLLWFWQTPEEDIVEDTKLETKIPKGRKVEPQQRDIVPINTPEEKEATPLPISEEKKVEQPKQKTPTTSEPKPDKDTQMIALAEEVYTTPSFEGFQLRNTETNQLDSIITNLAAGKIAEAIAPLQSLKQTIPDDLRIDYLLGLTYYHQKDFTSAIPYLTTTLEKDIDNIDIEETQWRLAIAYLQTQQLDVAKKILSAIAKDAGHSKEQGAVDLLGKIESL